MPGLGEGWLFIGHHCFYLLALYSMCLKWSRTAFFGQCGVACWEFLFACREVGKVLCSTCTAVVLFPFIQITFQHDLIDRLMTSNKRGSPLGIPLLLFKQLRIQTASMPLFTKSSGTCNLLLQPIFHLCRQVSLSYGEKFTYTTATISSWLQAEFSKNLAPREGYHDLGLAGI